MKKNLITTLANKNHVEQAKQLFSSVYWNAGWKGDYMLLAHEIPEKKLKWFRKKGILIKKCKSISDKNVEGYSPVVLSKAYVFTPEFKKWKNIIFLDTDIIVRKPLENLAKVKGFNAVKDHIPTIKGQFVTDSELYAQIAKEHNLNTKSFNSGVFAFSTDMIKKDTFKKLKKLIKKYYKISRYGEQGIFNIFLCNRIKFLPKTYNIYLSNTSKIIYKLLLKNINGKILHFAGKRKPWDKNSSFYPEWKSNLEKAELINIKEPLNIQQETKESGNNNKALERFYLIYNAYLSIDKQIGKIGIFLKNHFPSMYYKIKSLKKK